MMMNMPELYIIKSNSPMKGYKGMHSDMTCRGFQYEVGKEYEIEGSLMMCNNGFHFCKYLIDAFNYYDVNFNPNFRYFEVESKGELLIGKDKCVTSKIAIVRELSKIEINRGKYSFYYGESAKFYNSGNGVNGDKQCGDGFVHNYSYCNGKYEYISCGDGLCSFKGDGSGFGYGLFNSFGSGNGAGFGHNIQQVLLFK